MQDYILLYILFPEISSRDAHTQPMLSQLHGSRLGTRKKKAAQLSLLAHKPAPSMAHTKTLRGTFKLKLGCGVYVLNLVATTEICKKKRGGTTIVFLLSEKL